MATITITKPDRHKVGSTWELVLFRRYPDPDDPDVKLPVDLTGLTLRSTFRIGSVFGPALKTLIEGDGIEVDRLKGRTTLVIENTLSATVPAGVWVYFDVEMLDSEGHAWQSPTYRLKTEAEVTRDD